MNEYSSNMNREDRTMEKMGDSPAPPSFVGKAGSRLSPPVEEGPSMRSVAVMSNPGPSFGGISDGLGSLKLAPPSARFGSMKTSVGPLPKMGIGIARPVKLSGKSFSNESGGYGCTKEWDELIAAPSSWNVKPDDLELVPIDFPLERTHREIDDADAAEVSKRISKALSILSIDAEYNAEKAKAKCKTADLVKFRIRLYAGSESGMPVIVEVQKRSGSSSSFMRSCREILKAAEGVTVNSSPKSRKGPASFKGPITAMNCLKDAKVNVPQECDAMSVLKSSLSMFRSKSLESNALGLENLCSLTDPIKTTPVTALAVSKHIILEGENDTREDIFALLQRDVFVPDFDVNESYAERMHHHALVLLSNTLEMCAKDGCLGPVVEKQVWFEESLIPSLIDEVKTASFSAANAFQAVRCLQSILSSNTKVCSAFKNNGGFEAIRSAHEFSVERHQLLAEETNRFMTNNKNI